MLAAFLLAMVVQEPAPSREERVLELLRTLEAQAGSWHYLDAHFEPWSREGERQQLTAMYPVVCLTASEGRDDARMRRLALDLLRIFDLDPRAEHAWADRDGMARLDGLDIERRVGFELRCRGTVDDRFEPHPEDEAEALDDAELERLRAAGYQLHVTEWRGYPDDEDGFTPALAFLADLVAFLNQATEGEDVELGGLLFEREASWPFAVEPTDGMRVTAGSTGPGPVLSVERAVKVVVPCQGASDFLPARLRSSWLPPDTSLRELGTTTRGAPSVLVFKASAQPLVAVRPGPRPEFRVRVRQSFGTTELVYETTSFACLLPSSFDLAQPFELELELAPGYYTFHGNGARIGAAAPRR